MNRDVIAQYLSYHGFTLLMAGDGQAAVALAKSAMPDLILMDISLPALDGWEATRRIKADLTTKQIPVIALTAHALVADRQTSLDAGCDDYETKPIDFTQLLIKIRALTDKQASHGDKH